MPRAVFLNHLGTLIREDRRVLGPGDVELVKGAASAIASLRGLGLHVVVAANQPEVAHGRCGEQDVDAAHERIAELVHQTAGGAIDRFYYCPFDPNGSVDRYRRDHPWRLPNPGMFLQAADDLGLDLSACWMVGRTADDVRAARAAGMRCVRVTADGGAAPGEAVDADLTAANLIEAVRLIAQQPRRARGVRKPVVVTEGRSGSTVEAAAGTAVAARRPAAAGGGAPITGPDSADTSSEDGAGVSADATVAGEPPVDTSMDDAAEYGHDEREIGGPDPESALRIRRVAIDLNEGRDEVSDKADDSQREVAEEDGGGVEAAAEPAAAADTIELTEQQGPATKEGGQEVGDLSRSWTVESETEAAGEPNAARAAEVVDTPATEPADSPATARPSPVTTGTPVPARRRSSRSPRVQPDSGPATDPEQAELLRQILSALKRQSVDRGDFSVRQMFANFVFMIGLLCVVVAVIFRDQPTAFMQWMAGAVVALLFMIVLILGDQRR